MTVSTSDTIQAGKNWLNSQLAKGVRCPLCNQHAKMYRRKINTGMAKSLIRMYRINQKSWVHVSALGAASREEGKLAYWGLVEEQKGPGSHGGRAGYWRVTDDGEQFLLGRMTVSMYALVYNSQCFGFDGPRVGIQGALGTRFDYHELMNGV